ncbi:hypothetical protein [Komagataeibacter kakiaceti]|uniref:hypothetical protein n=1 Tax=Komagataeibacter kakiaceti TaxID=943261 RepID=UPI001F56BCA6|nr:hypothetical protein [Komagataeibacter kakiaceti]
MLVECFIQRRKDSKWRYSRNQLVVFGFFMRRCQDKTLPTSRLYPKGLLEWEGILFPEPLSNIHWAIVMDAGTFHFLCAVWAA